MSMYNVQILDYHGLEAPSTDLKHQFVSIKAPKQVNDEFPISVLHSARSHNHVRPPVSRSCTTLSAISSTRGSRIGPEPSQPRFFDSIIELDLGPWIGGSDLSADSQNPTSVAGSLSDNPSSKRASHRPQSVLEARVSSTSGTPLRRAKSLPDIENTKIDSDFVRKPAPRILDLKRQLRPSSSHGVVHSSDGGLTPVSQEDRIKHVPAVAQHSHTDREALQEIHSCLRELEFYQEAANGSIACVRTMTPKQRVDANNPKLKQTGRRRILIQKHSMQIIQSSVNGAAIFATWWWMRYFYVLLPFITAAVAMNVIMIFSLFVRSIKNRIVPEEKIVPESAETLVMIVPCYNETKEELLKTLDSLVGQDDIDAHKRAMIIVCDGEVRGPGMAKTTADYLLQEILTDQVERTSVRMPEAYLAWDQQFMSVVYQSGIYKGVPYICIFKQQNQGKRDSLILVRSFLYNFNIRHQGPTVVMSNRLLACMATFLLQAGISHVDILVGIDADTLFEPKCIKVLIEESQYKNCVGVCGYVSVDFSAGHWDPWRLYQSTEYTIAQALRRLHQSMVTKKVSCLPGCCQLLKVCEATYGDEVLIEKFGYCPSITDGLLTHIRATASEDQNHVCHMLSARPRSETRQALGARAVTDVPHSWSVFLSQRRRWTLRTTSNDLLLAFAPGVQWFERTLAIVNVFTWYLNPFIFASLASFIYATLSVPIGVVMPFVGVMLIPTLYYICIPLWLTKSWRERVQFWLGCRLYVFCGPFINIAVLLYASWNLDSFGWGKMRKVMLTDGPSEAVGPSDGSSGIDSVVNQQKAVGFPQPDYDDRMGQADKEEQGTGIPA